jgi:peroxiredoxin
MILSSLNIEQADFEQRSGWLIKPSGACKDDVCIPLPPQVRAADGLLDVRVLAERINMPLISHDESIWALGPASTTGRALSSAVASELELPDLDGKAFRLSSLRGRKVVLVAWASWCGCRMDLKEWQAIRTELHPLGLEIVTVALDTQGAAAARPWIEAARPEHPSLIDVAHRVGELFGISNVPNGVWIDEHGMIVRPAEPAWPSPPGHDTLDENKMSPGEQAIFAEVKKIRIEHELYRTMIYDWARHGAASRYVLSPDEVVQRSLPRSTNEATAAAHFELGQHLHRQGNHAAAVTQWRAAHRLQPDNWTYKRQAWHLEDPVTQSQTGVYEGSWLEDVRKIGAENYFPKIVV